MCVNVGLEVMVECTVVGGDDVVRDYFDEGVEDVTDVVEDQIGMLEGGDVEDVWLVDDLIVSASFTSRKLSFVLEEILPFPTLFGGGNVLQVAGSSTVGACFLMAENIQLSVLCLICSCLLSGKLAPLCCQMPLPSGIGQPLRKSCFLAASLSSLIWLCDHRCTRA